MVRESQIAPKIKRAKEHIKNLDGEIRRFFDTNPYKVGTKCDPESGPSDLWACPKRGGRMMLIERLTVAEIQLRSPPVVMAAA